MFLLVDIEDLVRQYPEHSYAGTRAESDKTTQLQMLEVGTGEFADPFQRQPAKPHPALVAQTLSDLAAAGDIPHVGINIPETGQ